MNPLVGIWRSIIRRELKSWVLFKNGTCVILVDPPPDLAAQAISLLKEWGPVYVATPAADFATIALKAAPGWVVTSHHEHVLTYVGPEEVDNSTDVYVGLLGRSKRDMDARELEIIHIEDRRANSDKQ